MEKLTLIKVGGKIVESPDSLKQFLNVFASIKGHKILIHGGGRSATALAEKLGIKSNMVNGRRVTDSEMLNVATMVYGGLVNKNIVAALQALDINALGLTGADLNCIRSVKRPVTTVDYGYVGDPEEVNADILAALIRKGITPVVAPITHDKKGNLLNTNADTIAGETAKALARYFSVTLIFCFEEKGVLSDKNDKDSVIKTIDLPTFEKLISKGIVRDGMIPKLENAFEALKAGVGEIFITSAEQSDIHQGTKIIL